MKSWLSIAILLVLAGTLFFLELGTLGLTDVDEGNNAEAAREMVESGDWVSPTFHYEPRWKKPVFLYWLISLAYQLFGVSEFTARLPSATFGVALILLQYLFLSHARGHMIGFLGALMLVLNVETVAIGHMVTTDSVLIFFTTLALYSFWLGLHGTGVQRQFMWLFYIGMGFGALTKGPIGLLVPLLVSASYLAVTRRWNQYWQHGFPVPGALITLSIALPWYVAMLMLHGSRYWNVAYQEMAGRFFSTLEGHGGTIFFYVPVLLFGFFPWSGLLPAALYDTFKTWQASRYDFRAELQAVRGVPQLSAPTFPPFAPGPRSFELEWFAGIWVVAVFLFFSASSTRLLHYIAPLFPPAALLVASYWSRAMAEPMTRWFRASIHLIMVSGYVLGLALASAPALYSKFVDVIAKEFPMAHQADPGLSPVWCGAILVIGSTLIGYAGLSEKRRPFAFWVAGVTIGLVLLVGFKFGLPRYATAFVAPPQQLAYIAGVNLRPEDRLILYGSFRPSLIFYARRKTIIIHPGEEEQLRQYLFLSGRTIILLPSRLRAKLPTEAAGFPVILERSGYSLVANEPIVKAAPAAERPPTSPINPHGNYRAVTG